jgi:hypothetical protein
MSENGQKPEPEPEPEPYCSGSMTSRTDVKRVFMIDDVKHSALNDVSHALLIRDC